MQPLAPRKKWGRCFAISKLVERSGLDRETVTALLRFYAKQGLAGTHESREGVWLAHRPKQTLWFGHSLEPAELEAAG